MSKVTQVYEDLVALKAELWNAAEWRLRAEFGLPLRDFLALSAIDRFGQCQVEDVAAELAIGVPAARKLISQLEAEGHCYRGGPRDADRPLRLTPSGQSLVNVAGPAFDDELDLRLGTAVPAPVLARFTSILKRLRRPVIAALPSECDAS
jgi:DNA-binding MarR family transcriptional regulator